MRLHDGTVLMHEGQPYDPVKAHQYYLRTRKLKGRRGSSKTEKSKFVQKLAYVQEGGDPKVAAQIIKWAQSKSDEELKKMAEQIKKKYGTGDSTMVFTINQLLKHREAVRAKQKVAPKKPDPKVIAKQKATVAKQINGFKKELSELNDKLKERLAAAKKGPTASEKTEAARESKKYRKKNQQQIKTKRKQAADKGSDSAPKESIEDLKRTIGEVRSKLAAAVARQRALG